MVSDTTLEDRIRDAQRAVGYRKRSLGDNLRGLQHAARQMSKITRTGPEDSARGVRLLAEVERLRSTVRSGREMLQQAEIELEALLAEEKGLTTA